MFRWIYIDLRRMFAVGPCDCAVARRVLADLKRIFMTAGLLPALLSAHVIIITEHRFAFFWTKANTGSETVNRQFYKTVQMNVKRSGIVFGPLCSNKSHGESRRGQGVPERSRGTNTFLFSCPGIPGPNLPASRNQPEKFICLSPGVFKKISADLLDRLLHAAEFKVKCFNEFIAGISIHL